MVEKREVVLENEARVAARVQRSLHDHEVRGVAPVATALWVAVDAVHVHRKAEELVHLTLWVDLGKLLLRVEKAVIALEEVDNANVELEGHLEGLAGKVWGIG